jgi:hypothetical protein
MEQDFPITKTQLKVLLVGLLVMAVFGAALFGGAIPGLRPNFTPPSFLYIDGEPYYYTTVNLGMPNLFSNETTPVSFAFHNVTFVMWIANWGSFTGGIVRGNGTETNGTTYPFVLGQSVVPPVNTSLYVSPDRLFAVYWPGGPLAGSSVRLMVRV